MEKAKKLSFLVDFLERQEADINEITRRLGMYKKSLSQKILNDDMKISEIIEIYDLYNYDIIFTLLDTTPPEIITSRMGFLNEFIIKKNLTIKEITKKCEFPHTKLKTILINDNSKISVIYKISEAYNSPLRIIERQRTKKEETDTKNINANDIIITLSEFCKDASIKPSSAPMTLQKCIEIGNSHNCKLFLNTTAYGTIEISSEDQIKKIIKLTIQSQQESIKTFAHKIGITPLKIYQTNGIKLEDVIQILENLFKNYKLIWKNEDQEIEVEKHTQNIKNIEILQELNEFLKEHYISRKTIAEKLHIANSSLNRMFKQNTFRLKRIEEITLLAGYKPVITFDINNKGKNQVIGEKRVKFLYEIMTALNLSKTDLAEKMNKHTNGVKEILKRDDMYIKDIEKLSQELQIPYTITWEKC